MSWVEKYRPHTLAECVGVPAERISQLIADGKTNHLLLYGPPGTGKTTIAHCIGNEMLGENKHANFKELNASNERGIDAIRYTVIRNAKLMPLGVPKKIILLDESDAITKPAQEALRRPLEQYENNTIFIFTANNRSKIHDAIASRCIEIEVTLSEEAVMKKLKLIADAEGVEWDTTVVETLVKMNGLDLRKLIGALEVYNSTGTIVKPEFMPVFDKLFIDGDWKAVSKDLKADMLPDLFEYAGRTLKPKVMMDLTLVFSKYDWQLSSFSTNPQIQLQAFAIEVSRIMKK